MRFLKDRIAGIVFILVFLLTLPSCSTTDTLDTIHTAEAILGLPGIIKSFGRMKEGQIYRDSKDRFEVPCPEYRASVKRSKYGVTFEDAMWGLTSYAIYAYDASPEYPESSLTIENTLEGVKLLLRKGGIDIKVVYEEDIKYRGYDSLNFAFTWEAKNKNNTSRIYVSRFIKTDNFVYWLYFSRVNLFNEGIIDEHDFSSVKKFFDSVKLEKEF